MLVSSHRRQRLFWSFCILEDKRINPLERSVHAVMITTDVIIFLVAGASESTSSGLVVTLDPFKDVRRFKDNVDKVKIISKL